MLKLGYWLYKPSSISYHDQEKEIRTELAVYGRLAQKHGVKAVFHTHSDAYFGCNASNVLRLIEHLNPAHVVCISIPATLRFVANRWRWHWDVKGSHCHRRGEKL